MKCANDGDSARSCCQCPSAIGPNAFVCAPVCLCVMLLCALLVAATASLSLSLSLLAARRLLLVSVCVWQRPTL